MPDCDGLLEKARSSPGGLRLKEAIQLAACWGFVVSRTRGSHVILKRPGRIGVLNFQDDNGKAKAYQVRQLLSAIDDLSRQEPDIEDR